MRRTGLLPRVVVVVASLAVPPAARASAIGPGRGLGAESPGTAQAARRDLVGGRAPAAPACATPAPRPATHTVSDLLERARELRFEASTSKLVPESLPIVADLAAALAREPATKLEIVVHTADTGDAKRDLALSRRRAETVKQALIDKGAHADQLVATGRGSQDPIAPNLTRTGRQRNERVELHRAPGPRAR